MIFTITKRKSTAQGDTWSCTMGQVITRGELAPVMPCGLRPWEPGGGMVVLLRPRGTGGKSPAPDGAPVLP